MNLPPCPRHFVRNKITPDGDRDRLLSEGKWVWCGAKSSCNCMFPDPTNPDQILASHCPRDLDKKRRINIFPLPRSAENEQCTSTPGPG